MEVAPPYIYGIKNRRRPKGEPAVLGKPTSLLFRDETNIPLKSYGLAKELRKNH